MPDLVGQRRQLVLHDVPDDVHVDAEVIMDENVPQAGYLLPLDLGMAAFRLSGQFLCCLAYYLQVADNRVARTPVLVKSSLVIPATNSRAALAASRMSSR